MKFTDLKQHISSLSSMTECEAFLKESAQEIRDLFYRDLSGGPTDNRFDAENAAISLLHSDYREEILQGDDFRSQAVGALLIYFIAYAARMGLHHLIQRISQILPVGDLKARTEALFIYKYITNVDYYYINRFTDIIKLLDHSYVTGDADVKKQCADIAIEYFIDASTVYQSIDGANYKVLKKRFLDPSNCIEYQILRDPNINKIINLPLDRLKREGEAANIRIAKAFYDEAAILLPVPFEPKLQSLCKSACSIHEGHCSPGLHEARERIYVLYPNAYSQTETYVPQHLDSSIYIDFDSDVECIRYLRQYQPLHMPQIETAVEYTMEINGHDPKNIHILDIGGGAGSLYCVLASLLHRGFYEHKTFEITIIEPSEIFLKYVDIVTERVNHPRLKLREKLNCRLDQVPQITQVKDFDWYFIANTITPLIKHAGSVTSAVDTLYDVILTNDKNFMKIIIAENRKTYDFEEFCDKLKIKGLYCEVEKKKSCDGSWLANCKHYLTSRVRPLKPYLKYACFTYSKRGTVR